MMKGTGKLFTFDASNTNRNHEIIIVSMKLPPHLVSLVHVVPFPPNDTYWTMLSFQAVTFLSRKTQGI